MVCAIPDERKVSTVRSFYTAFHDSSTLPICTCAVCYQKCARAELEELDWNRWVGSTIDKREGSPFACRICFSAGEKILGCRDCLKHLDRDVLSPPVLCIMTIVYLRRSKDIVSTP